MIPLVSILIPVYNRVNIVKETIESARNQTYENFEIIISDNCSTDGTWELLQEYSKVDSRIQIYQNETNIGPVRNWKRCIDEAKGVYSKILWSDDIMKKNFLKETVRVFSDDVSFVMSSITLFNETFNKVVYFGNLRANRISRIYYLFSILTFNKYKFPVSPGNALFRTNDLKNSLVFDIPNKYNIDFSKTGAGSDLLLFLSTAVRYKNIEIIHKPLIKFRVHEDSISISQKEQIKLNYYLAKLFFVKNNSPLMIYFLYKFIIKITIWFHSLK